MQTDRHHDQAGPTYCDECGAPTEIINRPASVIDPANGQRVVVARLYRRCARLRGLGRLRTLYDRAAGGHGHTDDRILPQPG